MFCCLYSRINRSIEEKKCSIYIFLSISFNFCRKGKFFQGKNAKRFEKHFSKNKPGKKNDFILTVRSFKD